MRVTFITWAWGLLTETKARHRSPITLLPVQVVNIFQSYPWRSPWATGVTEPFYRRKDWPWEKRVVSLSSEFSQRRALRRQVSWRCLSKLGDCYGILSLQGLLQNSPSFSDWISQVPLGSRMPAVRMASLTNNKSFSQWTFSSLVNTSYSDHLTINCSKMLFYEYTVSNNK